MKKKKICCVVILDKFSRFLNHPNVNTNQQIANVKLAFEFYISCREMSKIHFFFTQLTTLFGKE